MWSLHISEGNWGGVDTLVDHMLHMNQEPKVITERSHQVLAVFRSLWWSSRTSGEDYDTALGTLLMLFIMTVLRHHTEKLHTPREELEVGAKERPPLRRYLQVTAQKYDGWHHRNTFWSTPAIVKAGISRLSLSKLTSKTTTASRGGSRRRRCQDHFQFGDILLI